MANQAQSNVAALMRRLDTQSATALDVAQQALRQAEKVEGILKGVRAAIQSSAIQPLTNRERALASCKDMRPGFIVLEINFAAASTSRTTDEARTDTVGRFIVDRIRACWRSTAGAYGYVSSAQNPDLTSTNVVDFVWELIDGRNNMQLQKEALPSDILAKSDGDGFPAGGWVLEPGTDVTLAVTPTRAIPSGGGYVTFVLEGIQCYDQKGAP